MKQLHPDILIVNTNELNGPRTRKAVQKARFVFLGNKKNIPLFLIKEYGNRPLLRR